MKATLVHKSDHGEPLAEFELGRDRTVVGRRPRETLDLSAVAEKIESKEAYTVEAGNTLYIGIPVEMRLARDHFAIYCSPDDRGVATFSVHDLGSHGGLMVNDEYASDREVPLRDGDRIHRGFEFEFRVVPE